MRGRRCDRCDICGNSDDEVYLPACDVCKRDTCRECAYDFQFNDDGDVTWAICQECQDDEAYIPTNDGDAYAKVISAQNYILFARHDIDAFREMNQPRWDLVSDGDFVLDTELDTVFAKRWMDYAALEARKVVAS